MATPLYLVPATPTNGARGRQDGAPVAQDAGVYARALLLTRGASAWTLYSTLATNGSNIPFYYPAGYDLVEFLTPPLASAVTISGTVTFNIWAYESAMTSNATIRLKVLRIDSEGKIVSTIIDSTYGTELGTSDAARNWTGSPTSTSLDKGDRIAIVPFATNATGLSMGTGNAWIMYGAASAGVEGDSYVSFNETLTFLTDAPTGSAIYFTDTDAGLSLGVDYLGKEAWKTRGGSAATALLRANGSPYSGETARWADPDQTVWQATEAAQTIDFSLGATAESVADPALPSWQTPNNVLDDNGVDTYVTAIAGGFEDLKVTGFPFSSAVGRYLGFDMKLKGRVAYNLGAGGTEQALTTYFDGMSQYSPVEWTLPIGAPDQELTYGFSSGKRVPMNSRGYASWLRDANFSFTVVPLSYAVTQIYYLDYLKAKVQYGRMWEWYTRPLLAFTLSGLVRLTLRAAFASSTESSTIAVEVAVVDLDGSNPVVYGRMSASANMTASESTYTIDIVGTDISVTDTQRIRMRVCMGNFEQPLAQWYDANFYYNGSSGGSGDSYATFSQTLIEILLDSATASVDLQASTSDLIEWGDAPTVYYDIAASGTDEFTEGAPGYTDYDTVYIALAPSGDDTLETVESTTTNLDLDASGTELLAHEYVESATIYEDLISSGTDEHIFPIEYDDSDTIDIVIAVLGGECFSTISGLYLLANDAYPRWMPSLYEDRWESDDEPRWSVVEITSTRGC